MSVRCAASMASCTRSLLPSSWASVRTISALRPASLGELVVAGQVHGIVENRAREIAAPAGPAPPGALIARDGWRGRGAHGRR